MDNSATPSEINLERRAFLESGFDMAALRCPENAFDLALDVLSSNAISLTALIYRKGNQPDSANGLFDTDFFYCVNISMNAIIKLIENHSAITDQESRVVWQRLNSAFQQIAQRRVVGQTLVNCLLLFGCACYLMEQKNGKPIDFMANFPSPHLSWLRSLSPAILVESLTVNQGLMNCLMHLEQAIEKEKSAMLELDDPGFTDGERHRPERLH
jgi:hypothetical protein